MYDFQGWRFLIWCSLSGTCWVFADQERRFYIDSRRHVERWTRNGGKLIKLYGVKATRSSEKAKKLASRVSGEDHVIADNGQVGDEVMKHTGGKRVDYFVEPVGGQESRRDSIETTRHDVYRGNLA